MNVRDGFIVGVHNSCDGWCERGRFAPLCSPRESRRFPAPFWIEEDEPAPLPGVPPERQRFDARARGCTIKPANR